MSMFSKIKIIHRLIILISVIQLSVVSIILVLEKNRGSIIDSTNWIIYNQKALETISIIEKEIVDLETGQRGFLLTGKQSYLEPFIESKETIDGKLAEFEELLGDNPKQIEELQKLKHILKQKIDELEETIRLKKEKEEEAALALVNTDFGKQLMDEIMISTQLIRDEEMRLLELRSIKPEEAKVNSRNALILVFVLNLVFILIATLNFIRSLSGSLQIIKTGVNEFAKGNLEYRITDSRDELGELSNALNKMAGELLTSLTSNDKLANEINRRKEIEEELVRKSEKILMYNSRLLVQEKILEESNKELEQFSYVVSHDLQEPLKTISMFTTLIDKGLTDKDHSNFYQYMGFIDQSVGRMSEKINHILEYSRLGKKSPLSEVNCNQVLEGVLEDLDNQIITTGAKIKVGDLPIIKGYRVELELLFQNLLANALKFTREGIPPEITVNCSKQGNQWIFSITDNGIGIEEKYLKKIFTIFRRLHLEEDIEGSGIGLSHSQKIVRLHGGDIWVDSELGQGSTFYFTIPQLI